MSQSVRRCPFRHSPLREGWLQRELAKEIVAFPCTLDTGVSPFSCGLEHVRRDLNSANQGFTIYSFTDEPLALETRASLAFDTTCYRPLTSFE
jgi:hypothetical protein